MKRILILAMILAASAAFGQSAEPERAPTAAQCEADARTWGNELAEKIAYEKQPSSVPFSTAADQRGLVEWIKRWQEMTTCVNLQKDPSNDKEWPAITKVGIERHIFSDRFLMYVASHKADYEKWEAAEQAKARKMAQSKAGK